MTNPQFHYLSDYQTNLFDANQLYVPFPRPKTIVELCEITFEDGRKVYKHQAENVHFFANKANFRGVCADDTGLGKTLTVCALLHEFPETLLPILIVCKTTLKVQWWVELMVTCDITAQIIRTSTSAVKENAKAWIISYDLLKRIYDLSDSIKPKLLVLDECQAIKNWESARTRSLVEFSRNVPYIIGTSADPIKNDAFEYFPMMHISHPSRPPFDNRALFERWCELKPNGTVWKRAGIDPLYDKAWRAVTEDVIIRHKREDVMPDLPKVRRSHRYVKIEDEDALEGIAKATTEFVEAYDTYKSYDRESATMSWNEARTKARASLMRMRHLVGDAKVPFALDFVEEFLNEGEPNTRLTLFVHHKTVADAILAGIEQLRNDRKITCNPPFIIRGGMNEDVRNELVMKCTMNGGWPTNDPFDRLLVASTLAAGEGINLQKCHDCLMVERQFNPPNEEQAFGRFSRIGIEKGIDYIFATYLTALNTLDDWFNKINEFKRENLRKTHGDAENYGSEWAAEDEIVTDLMDLAAEEGRKLIKKIKRGQKNGNEG